MRMLWLLVAVLLPMGAAAAPDARWFQQHTQALYDALATGDPKPWDAAIAEDCIYTSEDGLVQDKAELLKSIAPLPKGFGGGITLRDFTVRPAGTAMVTHYFADEWEDVFGQHLKTLYVSTDTWAKRDGAWKIVATQTTVVPRDEAPVPVDSNAYAAVVGTYSFDPARERVYRASSTAAATRSALPNSSRCRHWCISRPAASTP